MLLEESVCYDQCILLAQLLAFPLLHFVLQGQTCLLLQRSLGSTTWISPGGQYRNQLIIFFAAEDGEALYSQQKQDLELTVAQIMATLL